MCNFLRFYTSFSAFNSCPETEDYYILLLASRSDVLLFWGVRRPTVAGPLGHITLGRLAEA